MVGSQGLKSLDLVLTARCNLKCAYCYQDDKNSQRMDWETLRASIDLLLASDRNEVDLTFYGGEPLLEYPLIRRAVAYVERHRPQTKRVGYTISTNGMLLDESIAEFFAAHDFYTQLSFDGVPAAQAVRGASTFPKLDRLLDRLRDRVPRFFRDQLTINITVSCATIGHLADSVEYFLEKGIRRIDMTAVFTHYAQWQPEMYDQLDEQFDRMRRTCLAHYRRTGRVPVRLFRRGTAPVAESKGRTMCGVPRGEALAVDVDGQVSGCVTLAASYQKYASRFLRDRASSMSLGDFRDPGFSEKLKLFPETTRATGLFHSKQDKYSSYGKCGDCRFLARCMLCPTSIGHVPGNDDPNRVPDFNCAFNLIALDHQDRFPAQTDGVGVLTGQAPLPEMMQELMRFVGSRPEESA